MSDTPLHATDAEDLMVLRHLAASDQDGVAPDLVDVRTLFDEGDPGRASWVVERLHRDGYVDGIDASSMAGFNLLRLRLTPLGRERLRSASPVASPPAAVFLTLEEVRSIEPLLRELRQLLEAAPDFDTPDDGADFEAQLQTAECQLRSPRPRRLIMREALSSLRSIGEDLVASGVWLAVGEVVKRLGG